MLQKVDFIPERRKHGDHVQLLPEYEKFSSLVDKANTWLANNLDMKLKNCETIEVQIMPGKDKIDLKTSVAMYVPYGKCRVRCLRLWVIKTSIINTPQQLGYLNVIPNVYPTENKSALPEFENLSKALDSLNESWKENPLPGSILCVITERQPFTRWPTKLNPDDTLLVDGTYVCPSFILNTLRIFFVLGEATIPQLGIKDFAPQILPQPKKEPFNLNPDYPVFEPFEKVQDNANNWIQSQSHLEIVSVRNINFRLSLEGQKSLVPNGKKPNIEVKTKRKPIEVVEPLSNKHHFIRLLRVVYNKWGASESTDTIISRCFLPRVVKFYSDSNKDHENQVTNISRISRFLTNQGEKLVSVETIQHHQGAAQEQDPCPTYWVASRSKSTEVIAFFRVYLKGEINGLIRENMHIDIPDVENNKSCVIS